MAFYNTNTGDITFKDPVTGESFVINTPVENYAWNSTPVTWTSSSTSDDIKTASQSSGTQYNGMVGFEEKGYISDKRHYQVGKNTITTSTDVNKQKRVIHTSNETKVSKTVSTATTAQSSLIPYMRAKKITFKASGMKPNAILVAAFGDEDVTDLCVQTVPSGMKPGKLKAGPTGTIEGTFNLPNNRFKAGAKLFKLFDAEDATLTFADARYTAAGTRVDITTVTTHHTETTKQKTVHDTTFESTENILTKEDIPPGIKPEHVDAWIAAGRPGTHIWGKGKPKGVWTPAKGWHDPVAQSFYVETSETNRGVFIHSIDLFFFEAEPEHDVTVEVRHMRDGSPTVNLVAEHAITRLPGTSIRTSINGSRHTRFTFPTPFFLPPGDEYCFVVSSTSTVTSLWCSELGKKAYRVTDTVEPTGELIAKQPYLGSMFISQNNTTWSPQQTKDLKFRINRASFKQDGKIKFINKADDFFSSPHNKRLKADSLEFTENSNIVTLYAHGHGLRVDDTFKLMFSDDFKKQLTVFGINIANELINPRLRVIESHPTHVKFKTVTKANGSGSGGGNGIWMFGWKVAFSYLQLVKNDLQLDSTSITYTFSGREWERYNDGVSGGYAIPENEILALPKIYTAKEQNDGGVTVDAFVLADPTGFTSPTIYADSLGVETHLNVVNEIDYMNNEGVVNPDSSPAKYIQKEVSLVTPANELKVYFESNLPYGSNASVYYQTGGEEIQQDSSWKKLEANGGDGIVPSASEDEWRTQKFEVTGLEDFKAFKVMIVLQSTDRLVVPRIKNYRAISLYGI